MSDEIKAKLEALIEQMVKENRILLEETVKVGDTEYHIDIGVFLWQH